MFIRSIFAFVRYIGPAKLVPMSGKKYYYAVGVGRQRGIYNTWAECNKQVMNIKNAKYRKFESMEEAEEFVFKHTTPNSSPTKSLSGSPVKSSPLKQPSLSQPANMKFNQASSSTMDGESSAPKRLKFSSQEPSVAGTSSSSFQMLPSTSGINNSRRQDEPSTAGTEDNGSQDSQQLNILDLKRELQLLKRKQGDLEDQINKFNEEKTKELQDLRQEMSQLENRITLIEPGSQNILNEAITKVINNVQPERKAIKIEAPPASQPSCSVHIKPEVPSSSSQSAVDPDGIELDMDEDDHCIIYTDGCCLNNGRDGARAGVGVWFGHNSNLNLSEPLTGDCRPTNNNAEIQAATLAMNMAKIAGFSKVNIHTDSAHMINCVKDWLPNWQRNGWKTANGKPVANKVQLEILLSAYEGLSVKWTHVRGHTNILGNEMADKLAKEGAKRYVPQ